MVESVCSLLSLGEILRERGARRWRWPGWAATGDTRVGSVPGRPRLKREDPFVQ
jgi:hypothetical protein